jgi:hypothetical protein
MGRGRHRRKQEVDIRLRKGLALPSRHLRFGYAKGQRLRLDRDGWRRVAELPTLVVAHAESFRSIRRPGWFRIGPESIG